MTLCLSSHSLDSLALRVLGTVFYWVAFRIGSVLGLRDYVSRLLLNPHSWLFEFIYFIVILLVVPSLAVAFLVFTASNGNDMFSGNDVAFCT